jgi:DNA-directed RNA polymerase subunit RPC12/RpoP
MLANVTCPACGHKYWIQEGDMGSRQICPSCQAPFFAGASQASGPPAPPLAAGKSAAPPAAQPGYAKTMIGETAPPIHYSCPRCKTPLEAPASEAGTKINCPKCSQRVQVPAAPKPEPVAAAPNLNKTMLASDESAAPPKPPIKYNCPNCKKPLESPAEQAGTKRHCPSCNQRLQIPAVPPDTSPRNQTMLAAPEGAAPASAWPAGSAPAAGSGPGLIPPPVPPAATNPWAHALSPKNVIIGVLVLLLVLLVAPALIRGGAHVDSDALKAAQMELEKLKLEIQQKQIDMDRQAKAAAEERRQFDEMTRNNKAQEDKLREAERQRLREADEDQRAALERKLKKEQQQREAEREEMQKKHLDALAEAQRKLDESKRALEASQQKQQTIIERPPPVIYYPPYHPRYYWPW